ncbi:unnamed protein product, partial [Trichobilharzia szidati]
MVLFNILSVYLTYNSQKEQRSPTSFYVWFIVDLLIMILTTVGAMVLYNTVKPITTFFDSHSYMVLIIFSAGAVLLFLCVFVTNIQSNYLAVRILLGIVVSLWSVSFATEFQSVQTNFVFALLSLVVTVVITTTATVSALKLPPLNEKGFVVFTTIAMLP